MSYCTNCGEELLSGIKYCPNCGTKVEEPKKEYQETVEVKTKLGNGEEDVLGTIAFVVMTLKTVVFALAVVGIIPLIWRIPMIIKYKKALDNKEPVDITFKVCTLIFVSVAAGILMIVDEK